MSNRALPVIGLAAAGGVGYYLYNAGGDPKLAEKKMEHDAANLTRRAKGDFPGQDKEAKKAGEEGYEAVRATAQQYSNSAKNEFQKAEQKVDQMSAEARKQYEHAKAQAEKEFAGTRKEVNSAIDTFDKKAIETTREAKGWFGGMFGGK